MILVIIDQSALIIDLFVYMHSAKAAKSSQLRRKNLRKQNSLSIKTVHTLIKLITFGV